MAIVAGVDVHRAQITFDALDTESGEIMRGRIDATPAAVTRWVERFAGREIQVAPLEARTGWLFVCDALVAAGAVARLAEPVKTRALRGRKRRAKTDRQDARWLRELLADGRLPESWIAPERRNRTRRSCSCTAPSHRLPDGIGWPTRRHRPCPAAVHGPARRIDDRPVQRREPRGGLTHYAARFVKLIEQAIDATAT
jgi:Transposase